MTNESLLDQKLCEHTKNRETVNYILQNNRDGGLVDIFARDQLPPDSREMHTVCSTVCNTVRPAAHLYIKSCNHHIYIHIHIYTYIYIYIYIYKHHFGRRWKLIDEPPCTHPFQFSIYIQHHIHITCKNYVWRSLFIFNS